MKIFLQKFGETLISRQSGSEAFKAFQSTLRGLPASESLEVDFTGVLTLSPSWADEFFTPLADQIGGRLILLPSNNLSVKATFELLEEISKKNFNKN